MKILEEGNLKKVVSEDGYLLSKIDDENVEDVYYFKVAYIPKKLTMDDLLKM